MWLDHSYVFPCAKSKHLCLQKGGPPVLERPWLSFIIVIVVASVGGNDSWSVAFITVSIREGQQESLAEVSSLSQSRD